MAASRKQGNPSEESAGSASGQQPGEDNAAKRRKRYERASQSEGASTNSAAVQVALTALKMQLLQRVFECRILSLPQVAVLIDCSEQSARRHVRELYDAQLLERIAVTRAELADPAEPNNSALLHGSAPNIHAVSRKGVERFIAAGLLDKAASRRPIPSYGPQNSLFLRHELLVRDLRVWLEKGIRAESAKRELMS